MTRPSCPRFSALLAAALLAAGLSLAPIPGGGSARAAAPSGETEARAKLIQRVEAYLNGIKTLRARFLQIGPTGGIARGTVLISRPGKLRIEYDPPSPVLILTQGDYLMLYDKELASRSYTPLADSLAGFLVRPKIRFSGDVAVRQVRQTKGVIRISVVKADAPDSGVLTLVFSNSPLQLRQWVIVDDQGAETRVSLEDTQVNVALDSDAFEFDFPDPTEGLE